MCVCVLGMYSVVVCVCVLGVYNVCVCVHAYFKVSVTAIKGTTSILECSVKMTGRCRKWKGVCVCVLEGGGVFRIF